MRVEVRWLDLMTETMRMGSSKRGPVLCLLLSYWFAVYREPEEEKRVETEEDEVFWTP